MSVVRLLRVDGLVLDVEGVDILDGTPLLDIKPYVSQFDSFAAQRAGWLDASAVERDIADDRFAVGRDEEPKAE